MSERGEGKTWSPCWITMRDGSRQEGAVTWWSHREDGWWGHVSYTIGMLQHLDAVHESRLEPRE